ncbi:GntR family transcriptional regulator [Bacillus oleivorans]
MVDQNGKLPTENELAETFQVSRVTVRSEKRERDLSQK